MNNDMFRHVNKINYYSYFDTVVNQFLIEQAGFNVKSSCNYLSSVAYPEKLIGVFRVDCLGKSSVNYAVGIFKQDEDTASAVDDLTHVFVDRQTQKPTPIQGKMREAMVSAMVNA
jgi:acyl-CoA thioester hydrolase